MSPTIKGNLKVKQFFDGRSHEENKRVPESKSSSKKPQYSSVGGVGNVLSDKQNIKRHFLSSDKKARRDDEPLDDDDYEIVMAEEVDDNLIYSNRALAYG